MLTCVAVVPNHAQAQQDRQAQQGDASQLTKPEPAAGHNNGMQTPSTPSQRLMAMRPTRLSF